MRPQQKKKSKIGDLWVYLFVYFLIWANGKLNILPGVYLQNAEQSVCEDYLFWALSKLSETGSRVWAFVKSDFAQVVFSKCKDIQQYKFGNANAC